MARTRKRSGNVVSLFPFLSVLACIIGTLTLLITATAIGEIGPEAIDLDAYDALEREIAEGHQRLTALRALEQEVASAEAAVVQEQQARDELAEKRARYGAVSAESAPLRSDLEATNQRVDGLEAELASLDAERDALAKRISERRTSLASAPIGIEPSGSGTGLEPHFAECRGDGVVLYEGPDRHPIRVPASSIEHSLDVRAFLADVRAARGASAILLVRPSGVGTCRALAIEAARQDARNGLMPIPENGELDFSAVTAGAE